MRKSPSAELLLLILIGFLLTFIGCEMPTDGDGLPDSDSDSELHDDEWPSDPDAPLTSEQATQAVNDALVALENLNIDFSLSSPSGSVSASSPADFDTEARIREAREYPADVIFFFEVLGKMLSAGFEANPNENLRVGATYPFSLTISRGDQEDDVSNSFTISRLLAGSLLFQFNAPFSGNGDSTAWVEVIPDGNGAFSFRLIEYSTDVASSGGGSTDSDGNVTEWSEETIYGSLLAVTLDMQAREILFLDRSSKGSDYDSQAPSPDSVDFELESVGADRLRVADGRVTRVVIEHPAEFENIALNDRSTQIGAPQSQWRHWYWTNSELGFLEWNWNAAVEGYAETDTATARFVNGHVDSGSFDGSSGLSFRDWVIPTENNDGFNGDVELMQSSIDASETAIDAFVEEVRKIDPTEVFEVIPAEWYF